MKNTEKSIMHRFLNFSRKVSRDKLIYVLLGKVFFITLFLCFNTQKMKAQNATGFSIINFGDTYGYVFYPTSEKSGIQKVSLGPKKITKPISVIKEAGVLTGRKLSVVIISHGILGTEGVYAWVCDGLAKEGYFVIAPHHNDQSAEDWKERELFEFWERPQTISKTLDWLIEESKFKAFIDADKIYFIGHSVGGNTGMYLAGAKFNMKALLQSPHGLYNHKKKANNNTTTAINENSSFPNKLVGRMQKAYEELQISDEAIAKSDAIYQDARIKKFCILDPLPIYPGFEANSLKAIASPFFYGGSSKSELFDSDAVKNLLASIMPSIKVFETGAGHFIYADEGKLPAKIIKRSVFVDPPGISRKEIHNQLSEQILSFLKE